MNKQFGPSFEGKVNTEVYKFTHGIYIYGDNLLPRAPKSVLRGHEYKLKKKHSRTQLRANVFSYRVVNL